MTSTDKLIEVAKSGAHGKDWYLEAHEWVTSIATKHDTTPHRVAHILAATSPKVTVGRNVKHTLFYLETGEFLPDCMTNSRNNVKRYEATGEISGQKIQAFAAAILLDQDAIVLDTWMAKALAVPQSAFTTKKAEECKKRISKAAQRLAWTPAQVQAAIWTATIEKHNRTPQGIH